MTGLLSRRLSTVVSLFVASTMIQYVSADCTLDNSCCNVCRGGGKITNTGTNFDMEDTQTGETFNWNCGFLEMALADVNVGPRGAPGEARYCGLAQLWVERGPCECDGPAPPPLPTWDINPACDLCGGIGNNRDFQRVPQVMNDVLADTSVAGLMPCGQLEYGLAEGVLQANLCPIVQGSAGSFCCNLQNLDNYNPYTLISPTMAANPNARPPSTPSASPPTSPGNSGNAPGQNNNPTPPPVPQPTPQPTPPQPAPPTSTCGQYMENCQTNGDCCQPQYECRPYMIGGQKICRLKSSSGGSSTQTQFGN